MDIRERLEKSGLSNNEAKVYLYLVDYGQSKAGDIANGCGIQRSSAYGAINSLVNKGMLSYVILGSVKFFQATSPNRLIEYLKEQEELIQDILPELRKRHESSKKEGQVRVFKGVKGVQSVFRDILREGKDNDCFGSDGNFGRYMPVFKQQYIREQNRKNIKTRVLSRFRSVSHSKGTSYRFVDADTKSNIAVNIYGSKVGMIIWSDEPEAIIIENKTAAKSLEAYFEFMWRRARK